MSVACQKRYSIKIGTGFPQPTAYWKLGSIVAGATPASVGSVVLNVGGATAVVADGLIGPNSLGLDSNGGIGVVALSSNAGDFKFYQLTKGFTLRYWLKVKNAEVVDDFTLFNRATIGGFDWVIRDTAWPSYGVTFFDNILNDVAAGNVPPGDVNWHRYIVQCDIPSSTVRWKVDDTATVSAVAAVPPLSFNINNPNLRILRPGLQPVADMLLCEMGLWMETLLTEAEMTTDWNAGAGQTFP